MSLFRIMARTFPVMEISEIVAGLAIFLALIPIYNACIFEMLWNVSLCPHGLHMEVHTYYHFK